MRDESAGTCHDGFPGCRAMIAVSIVLFFAVLFIWSIGEAEGRTWIIDDDEGSWADYSNVQQAIDNATDGDLIHIYNGTYYGKIDVDTSVIIYGNGTSETRISPNEELGFLIEIYAENVSLSDIKISRNSWDLSGRGIRLMYVKSNNVAANNATVKNCLIENMSTGLIFDKRAWYTRLDGVHFLNSSLTTPRAIYPKEARHFTTYTISNCTTNGKPILFLEDVNDISIDPDFGQFICVNSANITLKDFSIDGGVLGPNYIVLINSNEIGISNISLNNATGTTLRIEFCTNVTIYSSTFQNCEWVIDLFECRDVEIVDILMENATHDPIQISGERIQVVNSTFINSHKITTESGTLSDLQITNCQFVNGGSIDCTYRENITISDSNFINSGVIQAWFVENLTVSGCNFNETTDGIELLDSEEVKIESCSFVNNYRAIELDRDDNLTILHNRFVNNNYSILWQSSKGKNVVIGGNQFIRNEYGIGPSIGSGYVDDLTIYNNTFYRNLVALYLSTYAANYSASIFQNSFIENVHPLGYSKGIQTWDNGDIGNYWSDYNGTDLNYDGIGDTPHYLYYFDPDNKSQVDRYPLMEPNGTRHSTWIVDDDNGSWADFDNIPDAIDKSKDNWTIKVYSGIYEGNLSIDSKLTIIGNSSGSCEIIGSGQGSAVVIGHDNVTIMGFSISGGGSDNWDAGIDTNDHQGTIIRNCRVHDNDKRGILISEGSEHSIIKNCVMSYNIGHGITILGNNNSVIGCNSSYNDGDGIRIWDGYHNIIRKCIIQRNAEDYYKAGDLYDVVAGLSIIQGGWNIILDSNISDNFGIGIYLFDSLSDIVENCSVDSNYGNIGIDIYKQKYGAARFKKMRITIKNSSFESDVICLSSLVNFCQIHHNDFNISNSQSSCYDFGRNNSWDDGFEGNYWSDYEGMDLNNDGIGDSPYFIFGKSNSTDRYPLMEPNGPRREPMTWIVDDDNGSWADFDNVQDAIDASLPGDTIWLFNGSYQLEDDLLQIGITIQGNGSDTRLSGAGTIKVLTLGIRDTTIRDLTIVGDPFAPTFTGISAILIRDSIIERCWFEDGAGIYIWSAWNLTLRSCHFTSAGITYADFELLNLTSHSIENCTLDGKPIVFRKNDQNLHFDEEVGQLILVNCENIEIDGLSFSNRSAGVFISYCTNVTVNNVSIEGCYGGFYVLSCEDVRIQNCYFTETVYSIFIRLTVNITITYNIFIDLIEYPIRIDGCEDVEIVDNRYKDNVFPIKIKESDNLTFSNNTGSRININITQSHNVTINRTEFQGDNSGFEVEDSDNIWIMNSTFDNSTRGIDITETNDIFILYCYMYYSIDNSINLELCMNVTIQHVLIKEAGNQGIRVYNSHNILIDSISVRGCVEESIWIYGYAIEIKNCVISENLYGIAIWSTEFGSGWNVTITDCDIFSNDYWAIYIFWRANWNQILNNTIRNNMNTSIGIDGDNNRIMGNDIVLNGDPPLLVWGDNNLISYNKIENNEDMALKISGAGNVIHHNMISLNGNITPQAVDRTENTWDDGFEGNYWSGYNGTDDDNDGIGDTPHYLYNSVMIIGQAADNYPLMDPNMTRWPSDDGIEVTTKISTDGHLVDGETITVTIDLGSHSGIPHESNITVRLKALLDGDELNEYVQNLTLPSGYSNYTIEQNVTLNGTGNFTFEAVVTHEGAEIDSTIQTVTSNPRDYTFSLIMDRLTSSADPGDRVHYTLTVENRGNVPQFFRLSCESDWISITNGTLYILPDSEKTSKVYATVPSDANGTINFTILAESVSGDDVLNSGKAKVEITVGDDDGSDPERITWIFVGASFGLLAAGFAGLWGTDRGRYFAIPLLLPLYSKLKKEAMTDHETRGRIVLYLNENPGAHFNRIKKELELKNGTTGYHLRVLESGGFIKSRADGMYRRFYPYGYKVPDVVLSDTEKSIVMQIIKQPGIKQREMASRLDLSQSTVAYHVKDLKAKGIVSSERRWGWTGIIFLYGTVL